MSLLLLMFLMLVPFSTDVLTVAQELRRLIGGSSDISVTGQYRVGDIRHNLADLAKISRILGYQPKTSFKSGLRKFIDWVLTENPLVDRYDESLEELRSKGLFK